MTAGRNRFLLEGRTALVTGACGCLGKSICQDLASLGCDLYLLDRSQQHLDQHAENLSQEYGVTVESTQMDLEQEAERSQVAAKIESLDVLVNNAAFVGDSTLSGWVTNFENQSIETWRRAIEVNLTACFHLSQLLTPLLQTGGNGSIVNIGSIYGITGPDMSLYDGTSMGNPAAYAASKGGLVQLTRWLATTLSPRIRVNCVSPGGIFRGQPECFVSKYKTRTPLGRMATEDDVSGAVSFLAGSASSYITGQNIVVDGGWTAW